MVKTEEERGNEVTTTTTTSTENTTSINDNNNKILKDELDDETPKTFPQIVSRIFSSGLESQVNSISVFVCSHCFYSFFIILTKSK
jgi:hypothetical protein